MIKSPFAGKVRGRGSIVNKLESFNGDYRAAEMVKAFLVAGEYRWRFPGKELFGNMRIEYNL